jgi:hypothetical protein
MLEDFIFSFLSILAEEEKITDMSIQYKILEDLKESDEDFNHVALQHNEVEWVLPLPNSIKREQQLKTVVVSDYI